MEKLVYKTLKEFLKDEKLIVEYLYVSYKLYRKYGTTLYKSLDPIKETDEKLYEILSFFKEEKYSKANILGMLLFAAKSANYNVVEVTRHENVSESDVDAFIKKNLGTDYALIENISNKVGIKVKTVDMKIYNRFLDSDVEKCLR